MKKFFRFFSIFFLISLLLTGCNRNSSVATDQPGSQESTTLGTLQVEYIGHASFLITAPDGTRIITDPYGSSRPDGLTAFPKDISANAVTISHFHDDHDNFAAVNGNPQVISKPGSYQVGEVTITGYTSDHGLVSGKSSGSNTVFVFEIEGARIVHLGDTGVVTQPDILEAMKNADIVFFNLKQDSGHSLKDQFAQLRDLQVRTIFPMHNSYEGHARYFGSATINEFLHLVPSDLAVVWPGTTLQVTANMPEQVVVLEPSANNGQ